MYNYCTPLVIVVVALKKLLHGNVSGWPCEQTRSSTQRYLIAAVMFDWLALNLSDAPSFHSSHVSLSTWVSHPASLSWSLRRSRLTTLPPLLLFCALAAAGALNAMRLKSAFKRG